MLNSINTLSYIGKVNLSVVNQNGKVTKIKGHNSGTEELFKFFAQSLVGLEAYKPQYIALYGSNDGTVLSPVTSIASITGRRVEYKDDNYVAIFNAMITNDLILQKEANFQVLYICVVSSDNKILTKMKLDSATISNYITPNKNLLVEWKMGVQNG